RNHKENIHREIAVIEEAKERVTIERRHIGQKEGDEMAEQHHDGSPASQSIQKSKTCRRANAYFVFFWRAGLHQNISTLGCLTLGRLLISFSSSAEIGWSISTSAIASECASLRPRWKLAMLIFALPSSVPRLPMKPGLSSLFTYSMQPLKP